MDIAVSSTNRGGAPLGNTNGAKPFRLVSDTLRRIAVQEPERLRRMCERVMQKVEEEGDVLAFREIADRIEGKVASQDSAGQVKIIVCKDLAMFAQIVQPEVLDSTARVLTDDSQS